MRSEVRQIRSRWVDELEDPHFHVPEVFSEVISFVFFKGVCSRDVR